MKKRRTQLNICIRGRCALPDLSKIYKNLGLSDFWREQHGLINHNSRNSKVSSKNCSGLKRLLLHDLFFKRGEVGLDLRGRAHDILNGFLGFQTVTGDGKHDGFIFRKLPFRNQFFGRGHRDSAGRLGKNSFGARKPKNSIISHNM